MEVNAARVATLMLRCNGRKDMANLGTLFSQWSARNPRDPTRRMTMGGAAPVAEPPSAVVEPSTDAFCAVQLTPSNSLSKQDSMLLSPKPSLKSLASILLSPATSLNEGSLLLPSQASIGKAGLDALLSTAFSRGYDDVLPVSKVSLSPLSMAAGA